MRKRRKVAAVVTRVALDNQSNDFDFWQKQTYQFRLAALEEIRRDYHQWKYGAEPEFQRVLTITQR